MQQAKFKTIRGRVCSVAVLAAFASAAWAAPVSSADLSADGAAMRLAPPVAEPMAIPAEAAQALAQAVTPAAAPANVDGMDFGQAADLGKLEQSRGGTDTSNVTNNTRISGTVNDNNAINVVTGNNTIDAGSFANMAGIPVVIQNTGANVLIQSSTTVNLQFK
jgi:guanyl-specific ribonuclease Sa